MTAWWRRGAAAAVVVSFATVAPAARADDASAQPTTTAAPATVAPSAPIPYFLYAQPPEKHWLRMVIEELVLEGLGELQYRLSPGETNYAFGWDWSTIGDKLTFKGLDLDADPYNSNQLAHPGAGALYYQFARSNGFDIAASSLVTFVGSLVWKQFGEFREHVTINDPITTTVAGISIGETGTQLGAFFDAGSSNALTQTLSFLFNAPRKVHDLIDGNEPVRSTNVDALGFTRDVGHEFELGLGTVYTPSVLGRTYVDGRGWAHTHLVNVAGYDDPGQSAAWLKNGNVSDLFVEGAVGEAGLVDAYIATRVAPVGWIVKDVSGTGDDRRGQRLFLGWTIGYDYALHDYDRSGFPDRISTVSPAGLQVEHDVFFGRARLRTRLAMSGDFGAVNSLAANQYRAQGGDVAKLPSVTQQQGYYWALGLRLEPAVELRWEWLRVGAAARLQQYAALFAPDRFSDTANATEAGMHDSLFVGDAWVGVLPIPELELSVGGRERVREGVAGFASARRTETSLLTSAVLHF